MSRSRARSSNSVSLFPFLAVLVCAMGALIFLLIVTTQRIRSEAVAKAVAEREVKKARLQQPRSRLVKPAVPNWVSPSMAEPPAPLITRSEVKEPERIEPIPGLVELGIARSTPVLPPRKIIPPLPEPELVWPAAIAEKPALGDPNIPLRAEYAKLEAARKAWIDAVQKKEQALANVKPQVDSLMENLRRINSQIEEAAQDRTAAREAQRELIEARNKILGQLAKVDRQIEEAKKQTAGSPTKFQVVPFDALTGTNYRPILIECTAAGMRFQPEDVLVTDQDFEGFTLGKNPLLAGARALSDYWTKVSVRSGHKEPMPYVLLIVRPSGAKFYGARQLLEALDRPFGYELVEESLPLDVPPIDPQAAELCRRAVAETLKEREDLKKLLVSRGPEILSGNPNYRVIRKPGGGFEVEHAPDGKFSENEFQPNQSRSPFDQLPDGRFGPSRSPQPNNPGTSGGPGGPGRIGVPPAPAASELPPDAGSMNPGKGNSSSPSGESSLTGRSSDHGLPSGEFKQPRLLPEDVIRRSQGHVPYEGADGNINDAKSSGGPENFAAPDPDRNPGGTQDFSTQGSGSNHLGETDAIGPGERNLSSQPKSDPLMNRPQPSNAPAQAGQSANPTTLSNPPTVSELASPGSQTTSGQPPAAGSPGTGTGNPTGPGAPASSYEPPMPNFSKLNSRRMLNQAEPYQRRWGLSDPRASIGFEREVTVRVEPNRLVVGNAFAVSYDARTTKDQLGAGLLEAIELTVRKWGRPPISFYWVPTIRFQVGNNEVPVYRHLTATAKAWGLETSAEGIE